LWRKRKRLYTNLRFIFFFYQMKQKQPSMEFFTSRKPSKEKVSPRKGQCICTVVGQVSVKYISDLANSRKSFQCLISLLHSVVKSGRQTSNTNEEQQLEHQWSTCCTNSLQQCVPKYGRVAIIKFWIYPPLQQRLASDPQSKVRGAPTNRRHKSGNVSH